jgi:hypothetical protein
MPPFSVDLARPIHNLKIISNNSFDLFCKAALKAYTEDEDYPEAVKLLNEIIAICVQIPGYDRLVLDYLKGITAKYELLLQAYREAVDREVDEKAGQIFAGNYLKTWNAAKSGAAIYEKLRAVGRRSKDLTKKKNLWFNLIKQNKDKMEFTLYSGKK